MRATQRVLVVFAVAIASGCSATPGPEERGSAFTVEFVYDRPDSRFPMIPATTLDADDWRPPLALRPSAWTGEIAWRDEDVTVVVAESDDDPPVIVARSHIPTNEDRVVDQFLPTGVTRTIDGTTVGIAAPGGLFFNRVLDIVSVTEAGPTGQSVEPGLSLAGEMPNGWSVNGPVRVRPVPIPRVHGLATPDAAISITIERAPAAYVAYGNVGGIAGSNVERVEARGVPSWWGERDGLFLLAVPLDERTTLAIHGIGTEMSRHRMFELAELIELVDQPTWEAAFAPFAYDPLGRWGFGGED